MSVALRQPAAFARADFYVSTTGNDSHSGARSSRFARSNAPAIACASRSNRRSRARRSPSGSPAARTTSTRPSSWRARIRAPRERRSATVPSRARGAFGRRSADPARRLQAGPRRRDSQSPGCRRPRQRAAGRLEGAGHDQFRRDRSQRQAGRVVLQRQAADAGPLAQRGFCQDRRRSRRTAHDVHGIRATRSASSPTRATGPAAGPRRTTSGCTATGSGTGRTSIRRSSRSTRKTRTITLAPPYHHYGYRKGQRYYAVNVLAELDSPGEWYLDRQTGMLYLWPPEPMEKAQHRLFHRWNRR